MQFVRTLMLIGLVSLPASAQTLVRSVPGPAAGALYGKACLRVADQNSDGYGDLLVGAPGYNAQRGAVFCLSGAFLATGTGTQTLWSAAPSANPGDQFGFALADIGDITGDGATDFLVGQPGYDVVGFNDTGAIRLLNGTTHSAVSLILGGITTTDFGAGALFGSAFAACGDTNGDGLSEVVVGAPGSTASYVRVINGSSLNSSSSSLAGSLMTWSGSGYGGNGALGTAIVSGFDLDGDGFQEFAMSLPGWDGSGTDRGALDIREATSGFAQVGYYLSSISLERLGQALDAAHDYDGDGVVDILAGAPNSPDASGRQGGRVVVLSGTRLVAGTPPYEIHTLLPGAISYVGQLTFDTHFGAAVCASGDLNNDGVGEILVGSPDYFTGFGAARGALTIFSGATGARWPHIFGSGDDHLGGSIAGALDDFNGDGFDELVVAGALSDAGGTDSGVVKCYSLFPSAPSTYCTGKTNSLGCVPSISWSGLASATSASPFLITCSSVLNQVSGLLIYSHTPQAAAFQGGTLCVKPPLKRTSTQTAGGSTSGSDCTGTFSYDFNARIQSGVDATLVVGSEVFAQYWSRDPASTSTTSLSNALRFLINP